MNDNCRNNLLIIISNNKNNDIRSNNEIIRKQENEIKYETFIKIDVILNPGKLTSLFFYNIQIKSLKF